MTGRDPRSKFSCPQSALKVDDHFTRTPLPECGNPNPKMRSQKIPRCVPRVLLFSLVALVSWWPAASASAAVTSVVVETSDRILFPDGTARPVTDPYARVGQGFVGYTASVYVMPFKLPALAATERVVSATLSLNLEGWSNSNGVMQGVDLYGIDLVNATSEANRPENFVDGTNPAANPHASLLQDNFLVPADIATSLVSGQTIAKQTTDIGWFIQALYDGGALANEYAFLTLTHDAVLSHQRFYMLSAGNATAFPKPTLTVTTEPIPASEQAYYLDATNGNDTGLGTVGSPWKTFARAQLALQPGNTLYCSGELGLIQMTQTTPVGTSGAWITYRDWPGKPAAKFTRLVFDGVKKNRYLKFQGVSFFPGEVATASYADNNAVYLAGGWYVTLDDCDIEGAHLAIPPADQPTNGFAPYTPVSPFPPPVVTAGAPGDASYITVTNCRIKNGAIGISVSENPAYTTKHADFWTITDNVIENSSEDCIRLAGGGGSDSYIARNYVKNQIQYQYPFNWVGYPSSPGVWASHPWGKVTQQGTGASGIFYKAELLTDGRTRFFILADDQAHTPARNTTGRWVLDSDPTVYFQSSDLSGNPITGDNAHTDCISIMGPTTNLVFELNRVEVSPYGGGAMKLENINGHPQDIVFQNNLFYALPQLNPALGAAIFIIAGGDDVLFRHNTIFAGTTAPLARAIRFIDTTGNGFGLIEFYNNIIGGGGQVNTGATGMAVSDYNLWLIAPLAGFTSGPNDQVLPARSNYLDAKWVDPATGDFHLQVTSPARNIGSTDPLHTTATDWDGNTRVGAPDAGAYEEQTP
jgi:hypothetical protein